MGCNLGLWRRDFEKVNGFDETYVGWGFEDHDLAVRLLRCGIKRKEVDGMYRSVTCGTKRVTALESRKIVYVYNAFEAQTTRGHPWA